MEIETSKPPKKQKTVHKKRSKRVQARDESPSDDCPDLLSSEDEEEQKPVRQQKTNPKRDQPSAFPRLRDHYTPQPYVPPSANELDRLILDTPPSLDMFVEYLRLME